MLAVATLLAFTCQVVSVHDGDTFTCSNGVRVRLAGIDAPEIGPCPSYRTCAPGNPYSSRTALEALARGRLAACSPIGRSYRRIVAWCSVDRQDLSCTMYRQGMAIHRWDRADMLCGGRFGS